MSASQVKREAIQREASTSQPKRVQLRRTKGYRKPKDALVVARPSIFGNPFHIGAPHPLDGRPMSAEDAVDEYRRLWQGDEHALARSYIRQVLRGRDLACWCPLDQPCHADVLLEIANREVTDP